MRARARNAPKRPSAYLVSGTSQLPCWLALEQGQDGSNVILWHRCSAEGIAALSALLQQEVVTTEAVEVMVYLLDGCPASVLPPLPLAHGRNYPSPHWLPVTLTAVGTCLPAPHTLTQ